ncbi:MAG TPA: phytoene/squalene synthase family protein [Allosphingosinicella sp.]|jgi:phytoene synthase
MNRTELVFAAGEAIRHGSKSFHMASRLFDRETRERAWLLYCWCRHCDDICDGQSLGFGSASASAPGSVGDLEFLTGCVLAGEKTGLLPFDALAALLDECPVPRRFILDHLQGFSLDAAGWRPRDEADLLRYCYHVAGAVGCMMAVVMGVPPEEEETLARASELGIAFQLSNIARDLRDDHEAGRCYLPDEWMELYDLDGRDPLRPDRREALVAAAGRLTGLALRFEASAHAGVARLPFRARWAVLAAARVYGAIGRRVESLGGAAWETRVVVPRREKLSFLLPALVDAIRTR